MSTLVKPYTFVAQTYIVYSQVNANFDTLYNWVNNNAIWADATVPFTAVPSGPSSDPSAINQLTRKGYVDQFLHYAGNTSGGTAWQAQAGVKNGTTDSFGNLVITFPTAFPNACSAVLLTGFGLYEWSVSNVGGNPSTTAVTVHAANMVGGTSANNTLLNVFWLAIGH